MADNPYAKYANPYAGYVPVGVPDPSKPLDLQLKQGQVAKSPYELRAEAAQAAKAEIDLKNAQDQYAAQHPPVSTSGLYGPDYLKTLSGSDQAMVKALTEGRLAFPQGAALRSPFWQEKLSQVSQFDPTFDATNYNARAQGRQAAITGKLGQSNNALNTAIGHLGTLSGQVSGTASHGGFPFATAVNAVQNAFERGAGDPGVTNFQDTAGKLADELESVYRNGGGAEAGVIRQLRSLDVNASEAQKRGVINNAMDLLASKMAANLSQYNFGTGGKPTWDMLDQHTRDVLSDPAFKGIGDKYFTGAPAPTDASVQSEVKARIARGDDPAATIQWLTSIGRPPNRDTIAAILANKGNQNPDVRPPSQPGSYSDSYLSQGMSGANEGLAGVLGAPVDLATSAINMVPKGINAIANTNIPTISDPFAGSQWFKNRLTDLGSILPGSADPTKQFTRRVGESVGAAAVPGMFAGSLPKAGAAILSGLGGGIGGATAQGIAPNNPLAEFAGEMVGGGLTGLGIAKAGQRAAQRGIEATVPTVEDLKQQAGNLYQQAETNGVVASPQQTQQLATGVHGILRNEGQIGPSGAITNADTNTSKAYNLIQQYAGKEMSPKEMNTVRSVIADSRQSADPADRRMGGILLNHFDEWASPLAPQFDQARSVASRYLQAQDLEKARELAAARASQFTGSGFENALRTEYRGLDRNNIKGNNYFSPDVTDAIQTVARGTPVSNAMRGLGRLAPTGPVSAMGDIVPAIGVGAATTPLTGGMFGGALAGAGIGGRIAATRMGIHAADQAELIARNGGSLAQAPLLTPEMMRILGLTTAAEQAKYLSGYSGQ